MLPIFQGCLLFPPPHANVLETVVLWISSVWFSLVVSDERVKVVPATPCWLGVDIHARGFGRTSDRSLQLDFDGWAEAGHPVETVTMSSQGCVGRHWAGEVGIGKEEGNLKRPGNLNSFCDCRS